MKTGPSCPMPDCSASCPESGAEKSLFATHTPLPLSEEGEKMKRQIYEKMNPRRRKFVDKIGYEQWDPFQAPKDPLDIRTDRTNRTIQELLDEFMRQNNGGSRDAAWRKGAWECAMGIIMRDEKFQGIFDFCLWYQKLLQKEGHTR